MRILRAFSSVNRLKIVFKSLSNSKMAAQSQHNSPVFYTGDLKSQLSRGLYPSLQSLRTKVEAIVAIAGFDTLICRVA